MVPSISFSGRECRHADKIFAFPARTEFSVTTGIEIDKIQLNDRRITWYRLSHVVFTETRKEASRYAEDFIGNHVRTTSGIEIAEQLDLFSEPTESSEKLECPATS